MLRLQRKLRDSNNKRFVRFEFKQTLDESKLIENLSKEFQITRTELIHRAIKKAYLD